MPGEVMVVFITDKFGKERATLRVLPGQHRTIKCFNPCATAWGTHIDDKGINSYSGSVVYPANREQKDIGSTFCAPSNGNQDSTHLFPCVFKEETATNTAAVHITYDELRPGERVVYVFQKMRALNPIARRTT